MNHEIEKEKWILAAHEGAVPLREGKRMIWGKYELALFNLGNEYLAVDNRCPHKAGPLSDGIVANKAVFCPLHNWKIDLNSGCALSGGKGQVKTYPVKILNDKIYINFEEGALCPSKEDQVFEAPLKARELD